MSLQISLVHQFEQQKAETCGLAFSQDGKQLISSDGKAFYLWRLNDGGNWDYERSFPSHRTTFPLFAPNGKMLSFIYEEETVKVISFNGKEVAILPCPSYGRWTFSPDSRWLVSNDKERNILLWDFVSNQSFSIPNPFPAGGRSGMDTDPSHGRIGCFLFTPDCQRVVLFADSPKGSLHICSFDPEHRRISLQKTLPHGMIDGGISPDGKMLATIVPNEQVFAYKEDIYVYDLASQRQLHVFPQTTKAHYSLLAFSPDSQYLMSCKTDGLVDIFSLDSYDCIAQFTAHPGLSSHASDPIGGLDWSKTGYIATGGASEFEKDMDKTDYTIKIWRVEEK